MSTSDSDAWRRPFPTLRQQRNDIWLGAGVMLGAVVYVLLTNSMGVFAFGAAPSLGEQIVWAVALAAPLSMRRRYPSTVVLAVGTLFIGAQVREYGESLFPSIALFLALYTLGAWGRDRMRARWVRIGVIVTMFAWMGISMILVQSPPPEFPDAAGPFDPVLASALYTIGFNALFFLGAYFFGDVAWSAARRQYLLEAEQEALRATREDNARQAVVNERVRIARDLHDVVAHHVSVMGIQASAARRAFDADREASRSSLSVIERTARTAIEEIRGLLGVLRADSQNRDSAAGGSAADASPGLEQLDDLVEESRHTLRVEYTTYGEPRPVPEAIALSAYRIVQEALTNTVKHASASSADVRVRYLERELELEVSDDGIGDVTRGRSDDPTDSGLGLVGMRERVAVHGGELEVGPARIGGFRVRVRLPIASEGTEVGQEEMST